MATAQPALHISQLTTTIVGLAFSTSGTIAILEAPEFPPAATAHRLRAAL